MLIDPTLTHLCKWLTLADLFAQYHISVPLSIQSWWKVWKWGGAASIKLVVIICLSPVSKSRGPNAPLPLGSTGPLP